MVNPSVRKKELRKRIKELRKEIPHGLKQQWDEMLCEQFFRFFAKMPGQIKEMPVYLYLDFGNEAGTGRILSKLWDEGARTAVPKAEGMELNFYEIRERGQLSPGYMGILEPDLTAGVAPVHYPDALVVVPGVAFDEKRYRLGYGGGFYDRFFLREPGHLKWGLAYDFQIVEALPRDPWDQQMDMVLRPLRFG